MEKSAQWRVPTVLSTDTCWPDRDLVSQRTSRALVRSVFLCIQTDTYVAFWLAWKLFELKGAFALLRALPHSTKTIFLIHTNLALILTWQGETLSSKMSRKWPKQTSLPTDSTEASAQIHTWTCTHRYRYIHRRTEAKFHMLTVV